MIREPSCRMCRDEALRILVNELLDWRGVPLATKGGQIHRVTYADILRTLEPLNEGRDQRYRITYDSIWIHAKRHYDVAAVVTYWGARLVKEMTNALAGRGVRPVE